MDAALLRRRLLEVLPDQVPGMRQSAIRAKLAARLQQLHEELPTKAAVNFELQVLVLKGLVHSLRRVVDGHAYRVYWREASYAPAVEAAVHG